MFGASCAEIDLYCPDTLVSLAMGTKCQHPAPVCRLLFKHTKLAGTGHQTVSNLASPLRAGGFSDALDQLAVWIPGRLAFTFQRQADVASATYALLARLPGGLLPASIKSETAADIWVSGGDECGFAGGGRATHAPISVISRTKKSV